MNERMNGTEDGPALLGMDRMLREYFQSEMPNPWPRLQPPIPVAVRRPVLRFTRSFRRLALAAAIALALFGYWAVARYFPQSGSTPGIGGPEIGKNIGHRQQLVPVEQQQTPSGAVKIFEEQLPTSRVINVIGATETKGSR
jgi:hypothetical protein